MISEIVKPRKRKQSAKVREHKQLIISFIHEFRRVKQGISPTFEQIRAGSGYGRNSGGTAFKRVQELIAEGWLEQVEPGARGIVPTKDVNEVYAEIVDPELKRIAKKQRNLIILRRM